MKNKYYIPSIEEFYVGFEYECKLNNGEWSKMVFKPNESSFTHRFTEEDYFIKEGNVRVKYLNVKDVNDMFPDARDMDVSRVRLSGQTHDYITYYVKNGDILFHLKLGIAINRDNNEYPPRIRLYVTRANESWDSKYNSKWRERCIYDGEVLNMSELKKLLKRSKVI